MTDQIFLESSLRCFIIAVFSLSFGLFISNVIRKTANTAIWIIAPLFFCFFIPPVAVAYGYSNLSFKLVQNPLLLQSLYVLIMICRLTAPVAILLFFIPKPLSPEGLHCYKLSRCFSSAKPGIIKNIIFLLKGSIWRNVIAFIIAYMLAFSEFELASLMNINHWSVSLFDSYSQGISHMGALRLHLMPVLVQLIMVIIFLFLIPAFRKSELPHEIKGIQYSVNIFSFSKSHSFFAVLIITVIFLFISVVFPLYVIIKSAIPGFSVLFNELWMLKELTTSLLFALSATILAYITSYVLGILASKKKFKAVYFIVFIPALVGMLPLSLIIFWFFQLPIFKSMADSPIPLLATLSIWCLPFVLILQFIFNSFSEDESIHTARLMIPFSRSKASELLWIRKFRSGFWIFFFVFTLAYFDLTASAILAPVSMTTITARFYNLMHYGESEKLSATVCLSIIVPILLFSVIGIVLRIFIKRCNAFSKSG